MSVNTLNDLRTNIADWVARTDLSQAIIDTFIDLTQNEILSGIFGPDGRVIIPPLRTRSMEVRDANFLLAGEYTDLPTGWLGFKTLKSGDQVLDLVSNEVFNATYASTDSTPQVAVYSIVADQIRVGPGADDTTVLDIVYWETPDNLVIDGSNWILTKYPNVFLYGALRHLALYCGMDSRVPYFQSAFMSQLAALHSKEKSEAWTGQLVSRALGVTVT